MWLSLIVDEKERDEIEVLPNLDYKIMQGNSLIDEFEGEKLLPEDFIKRNTPKTFIAIENKEALRNRLQTEYFDEVSKSGQGSIKAQQIFREIKDLNEQIKKDRDKVKSDTKQSDLLTANENKAKQRLKELHQKHSEIFQTKNSSEKNALRRSVDLKILEFIQENLDEKEFAVKAEITNLEVRLADEIKYESEVNNKDTETPKILKLRKDIKKKQDRLEHLENIRYDLRNLWQNKPNDDSDDLTDIDKENFTPFKTKPFFLWETQFLEIFFDEKGEPLENPGFDIVIANPPFVKSGKIRKADKETFARVYETSKGEKVPNFYTYNGNADIYVYFYEKGVNVLRNGGCLTFITSNKFFRGDYGERLREFLNSNTKIEQIIDFGNAPIFEATVHTSITVLQKNVSENNKVCVWTFSQNEAITDFESDFKKSYFLLSQDELKNESWYLENSEILRFLEKLKLSGIPLGEYVKDQFYRGLVTGFNDAFVINNKTRNELISADVSSEKVIKKFLRGRDSKKWKTENSDLWLIYIPWHFPLHQDSSLNGASSKAENELKIKFPAIYNHLLKFKKELSARNATETGIRYEWYALQRWGSDYWQEFEKDKIVWGNLATEPQFCFDFDGNFISAPACFLVSGEKFLLGVLNSSISKYFVSKIAAEREGGFFEYKPMYVSQIPIPDAKDWQKEIIENFVDYILFLTKAEDEKIIVNYFESIINALVYELFLTDELHKAEKEFFKPLKSEKLPNLTDHKGDELKIIRELFARLSDINHVVRKNIYFLDNIESVRIIEGKQ